MDLSSKKRSIIVEGADATGKSTLATKLGQQYGIYTFRAGPKPTSTKHAEMCMLYQNMWLHNQSCVWDRHTGISNVCNLPGLSKQSTRMHAYYVKEALQYSLIIVCTAENLDSHNQESYETGADLERVRKEHSTVSNNYKKMAHDLPSVIRYDFKIKPFQTLIEEIDRAISISI